MVTLKIKFSLKYFHTELAVQKYLSTKINQNMISVFHYTFEVAK